MSAYVIGKTVDEVRRCAVDEKGVPTGAELTASVTVKILITLPLLKRQPQMLLRQMRRRMIIWGAGNLGQHRKVQEDAGDQDGLAQTYTTYTAVTVGADGKNYKLLT